MTLRRLWRSAPDAPDAPDEPAAAPIRSGGGTTGKMRRAKPPNVIGRGPLLASAGLGVAIVAIVKDEAQYLEEWLAFHFALGVDHVFLYDNGSTDGSADLLERYQNHGLVTVVDWPLGGGQLGAYNHALRFFGGSARWLAFFDVDEFLVPLIDDDIPSFLARFPDAADVRVERKEFGYSGHRTPPDGLAIDAYTELANVLALEPDLPPRVKSIVQPPAISAVDVHLAFPADVPAAGLPTRTAEVEVRGVAQLNHYYTRSFEEFEAKRVRGSATGRIARPAVPFDLPVLGVDTAARRFSDRAATRLAELRHLEPAPYQYGSHLALDYFPRPNDLGRFAEFAVANSAAGEPQPRRVAAIKVRNRYDGVGLVGDLSGSGHAPAPGRLAGSVHTAVLLEHMRGRIVASLADDPAAGAFRVTRGRLEPGAEGQPARLRPDGGRAELSIALPTDPMLRCYALGFVAGSTASARLSVMVERPGSAPEATTDIDLPASQHVAGVVEIQAVPIAARHVRLDVTSDAEHVSLYDLFVIATG